MLMQYLVLCKTETAANFSSESLRPLGWISTPITVSQQKREFSSSHGITVFIKGKKQMTKCVPICIYAFMHIKLITELICSCACKTETAKSMKFGTPDGNLGAIGVNVSHSWL